MATAGATTKRPTHDMTLSDGTTTIGLMLADARGKDAPTAIRRTAYPRQSTKISNTNNKYSDLEPPYYQILQDDWTGGRGRQHSRTIPRASWTATGRGQTSSIR